MWRFPCNFPCSQGNDGRDLLGGFDVCPLVWFPMGRQGTWPAAGQFAPEHGISLATILFEDDDHAFLIANLKRPLGREAHALNLIASQTDD